MNWLERLQISKTQMGVQPEKDLDYERLSMLTSKGIHLDDAIQINQRIAQRDKVLDGRILCYECKHLGGVLGSWVCQNYRLSGWGIKLKDAGIPSEAINLFQRCGGFDKRN